MPESDTVIKLEGISQVYVNEREASLVIEDLSLQVNQGNLSVSLVRAGVAKRHCCPLSPGCSRRPRER